ncbi:MAG: ornithine carbamoyltransferase [SAR202 cluster bacterium]|nr:ornithine carbamoyltransferase [Chloroflexota bacterium]MQG88740.1 ornithine carbamoyltransferase [SAR202 cluster bacterium]|tara:strand:- start:1519 stop:2424 length:906 start_codon:yes stop_codon:yes gene_type:complete
MTNHFLKLSDIAPVEIQQILNRAADLKNGAISDTLSGKSVTMLFEKPSLRTKLSFWIGTEKLGGKPVYFSPEEVGLGKREPVADVAQVISRMSAIAVIRTFAQSTIEEFAANASIPVINALTDSEHPCQALADTQTITEHLGSLAGAKVAFIGDGNNVAVSLSYAVAGLGGNLVVASPKGYSLPVEDLEGANAYGAQANGSVTQVTDLEAAIQDADIVYTDVWTSMGQEDEKAKRIKDFSEYQVNPAVLDKASANVKFMHDLPAHPGEEISDGLLYDYRSIVFDQAENRLWSQAALMEALI